MTDVTAAKGEGIEREFCGMTWRVGLHSSACEFALCRDLRRALMMLRQNTPALGTVSGTTGFIRSQP
jgi:hypothetical protein